MPKVRGQHTCIGCYTLFDPDDPLLFPDDDPAVKAKRAVVSTLLRKGPYCNTCLAALVESIVAAQEVARGHSKEL